MPSTTGWAKPQVLFFSQKKLEARLQENSVVTCDAPHKNMCILSKLGQIVKPMIKFF